MKKLLKQFVVLAVFVFSMCFLVYADNTRIDMKPKVIYDQDGLKVTVNALEGTHTSVNLKMLFENDSDKAVGFQAKYVSMNNCMQNSMMSVEVMPGKKANNELIIMANDFQLQGQKMFTKFDFVLHIFDPGTFSTITDSEPITVYLDGFEDYVTEYDKTGLELYNNNDIYIVYKTGQDTLFGPKIIFYIENNSDQDIVIQARDASMNGFMIDGMMSVDIPAGKVAFDGITFYNNSIEENGITSLENVEFSFHIADMKTFKTIIDTDVIQITY